MSWLVVDRTDGRFRRSALSPGERGRHPSFASERCGSAFWDTQLGKELADAIEDMW